MWAWTHAFTPRSGNNSHFLSCAAGEAFGVMQRCVKAMPAESWQMGYPYVFNIHFLWLPYDLVQVWEIFFIPGYFF